MEFDGPRDYGEPLLTVADFEARCRLLISPAHFEFLYGHHGHPDWSTQTSNRAAFHAVKLRPRVLRDVSNRKLATTLLGQSVSLPVVIGPTGGHDTMDPDGERPTARAAGRQGALFVLSGVPSLALADLAGDIVGPWWKQVFLFKDRGINVFEVQEAEANGCGAIVLTVSNVGASYFHNVWRWGSRPWKAPAPPRHLREYSGDLPENSAQLNDLIDPSITWSDVDWLRSVTSKPLVVKGIQTAEDARLCLEHGVDGIVVSNHGGRYVQGARGALEALPEVIEAVEGNVEVYVDGGVRQGQDVLKALALGAKAVWIGRAARWGLTVAGEKGVQQVLEIFRDELDGVMGLCGVGDVNHVDRNLVTQSSLITMEN